MLGLGRLAQRLRILDCAELVKTSKKIFIIKIGRGQNSLLKGLSFLLVLANLLRKFLRDTCLFFIETAILRMIRFYFSMYDSEYQIITKAFESDKKTL